MKYVLSLNLSAESLVCRPCRDDVTRVLSNPSHVPRWRKVGIETSVLKIIISAATNYYSWKYYVTEKPCDVATNYSLRFQYPRNISAS
jgi:hypothetical protein